MQPRTHVALVTVAAEHGAGGDIVAPRVADGLGVPFLNRAFPERLAAPEEGSARSGLLRRMSRASTMLAGEPIERIDNDEGRLRAEFAEFLAKAESGGGVVLGRGGAVVLGDSPTALHVLLAGPHDARVARVAEREDMTLADADRHVRAEDRARKEFLSRNFGADADDRRLYHLVVDTVALGIDASVELVLAASRARTGPSPKES